MHDPIAPCILRQSLLVSLAIFALLSVACSTPASRIKNNPQAFSALPPQHQQLVQQGVIDKSMPPQGVFLAWGRPSTIRIESDDKGDYETWLYLGTRQLPVQTIGFTPLGCSYGGRGYYPAYESGYISIPYLDRSATFNKGKVIGYQTTLR